MGVVNLLDISTAHITKETNAKLEADDEKGALYVVPHHYGYFIYVPDDEEPETPDDLKAIFKFAKDRDCGWVKLDCDAEKYDELPTYNW